MSRTLPWRIKGEITHDCVRRLAEQGFFDQVPAEACVAIMPFVQAHMTGLEIGVYEGDSSLVFLDNCRFMYFIDPCVSYDENPDKNWCTREAEFLELLSPYADKFQFLRGMAEDVAIAEKISDLDFAFIDGNHEYGYVMRDIELYWPKIKAGGFMSGHDYSGGHPGVTQAVDDFFKMQGLPVEPHQYCWLVRKP